MVKGLEGSQAARKITLEFAKSWRPLISCSYCKVLCRPATPAQILNGPVRDKASVTASCHDGARRPLAIVL